MWWGGGCLSLNGGKGQGKISKKNFFLFPLDSPSRNVDMMHGDAASSSIHEEACHVPCAKDGAAGS